MRRKWFFMVPAAIVGIILFCFIGGELVMHLWNWLLPPLFGWHTLTFWQAFGILALCRILFGSLGGRHGYRSGIRQRLHNRWNRMTPEEREQFREKMRARCGRMSAPGAEARP